MTRRFFVVPVLIWCATVVPALRSQAAEEAAVRRVVAAVASSQEVNDLARLDTLFAPNPWVEIIEGSGVNHGWTDYRNNHLKPELAEMQHLRFRFFDIAPQVRGNVAWAPFRYELAADTPSGHVETEGRGTAILERRGARWLVVHLHTSGRRKALGG
jgi:ketosteroid isomerase-like protein